eukprot:NODE_7235_length_453_cov_450.128141.p4 GENE.NODE_7235_length_453_cov_450.128141~~NODE_7235_length_453_cov_450.128141.p4  ORF type:complete len:58 (-),score=44.11 NODE_7235_length_453_cov_450.128141:39-212(-)
MLANYSGSWSVRCQTPDCRTWNCRENLCGAAPGYVKSARPKKKKKKKKKKKLLFFFF